MTLMDTYRKGDLLVFWMRTKQGDVRVEQSCVSTVYVDVRAKAFLEAQHIPYITESRKTYLGTIKEVLGVRVTPSRYAKTVRLIERGTKYRLPLYNADIPPEQYFLYEHDITPFSTSVTLTRLRVSIGSQRVYQQPITWIIINDERFEGTEQEVLQAFCEYFAQCNPDVILMEHAFANLPYLEKRLRKAGLTCAFHRWDSEPLRYLGGRSFWSYGQVKYQDTPVRLHGRFIIDTKITVGTEVDVEGIMELCRLTGGRFQQLASRSFGAVFQASLIRLLVQEQVLVPYKEKPLDKSFTLQERLIADSGGLTLDPSIGLHEDVAMIDFSSLFPWLIYNHNISAETLYSTTGPFDKAPGINVRSSLRKKGLVPRAIKPLLDKRMEYKKNPSLQNRLRSGALKWVLVTSYGYLRFREFKLGVPSAHMAICAYARELLVSTMELAQEQGFEVVHGIVDCLFLKKKGITLEEVQSFCELVYLKTGIPIDIEGIFSWVCLLPSITDPSLPVPAKYFGLFRDGTIKKRGIQTRQRSAPQVVKDFQERILSLMSTTPIHVMKKQLPLFGALYKETLKRLPESTSTDLAVTLRVGRESYKHDIPQARAINRLKRRGGEIKAGMTLRYVYTAQGIRLPEEYVGGPDVPEYAKRLEEALYVIIQPFGVTKEEVRAVCAVEYQTLLTALPIVLKAYK